MINKIKNILFIIFLIYIFTTFNAFSKVEIKVKINDEIITNIDIKKESEYLKILNPNLAELEREKILKISKISLINEIIKKNEVLKIFGPNLEENLFLEDYLKDLYTKLGYKNEKEFKEKLEIKNTHSFDKVKYKIMIELYWNELIFRKYNNLIEIDKASLLKKLEKTINQEQKEYNLSEIVFEKQKDLSLEEQMTLINSSIDSIGFKNTANLYSISQTSKFGGELGWIKENVLAEEINNNLKKIKEGEITDIITISNNYLILKINKIRINKIKINKDEELNKLINIEREKKLNQFSRNYFNKSKINYSINEI